jgi:hypothetical protein
MTSNKLRGKVKTLEAALARLKPAPAPSILTSHTTRGVVRRPIASAGVNRSSTSDSVPRWG